ncbi:MAG TPA: NAD(P)/FAD-dependent oxidoreductase [Chitinispirillaceae bacterium]|nr:NAD(P)/FAD-dependent oxidoreductase [Chitinispirillaceae bacterium]
MSEQNSFDIVVVGGGPAGIMAAQHASKNGKSVCLIDRKEKIGYPVRCGEGIGLKGFGISNSIRDEWIRCRVNTLELFAPSGKSVSIRNGFNGFVVDRIKMETDMTNEAVQDGTCFIAGTEVTDAFANKNIYSCVTSKGTFTCKCLILADGIESRIARNFGWKTALSLNDIHTCATAVVSNIAIKDDSCALYLGQKKAPGGFIWIFPRSDTSANIGLGISGKYSTPGKPMELLNNFLSAHFPKATITEVHAGGVPMGRWVRPLVKDGVMLVGDAARQMNCLNGAGINYSLFAGKAAGIIAAQSINGDTCNHKILKRYEKIWAREFGKQQERSYALKEAMIHFTDDFMNEMADSILMQKEGKMSLMKLFLKAFSSKPFLMYKVYKLFSS